MGAVLTVEKLGPFQSAKISPKQLTLLVGEQATGKSLLAQLLFAFGGLKNHLARAYQSSWYGNDWEANALKELLDELRATPFHVFANGSAVITYRRGRNSAEWKLRVNQKSGRIWPL